jgi:hypothetical protein
MILSFKIINLNQIVWISRLKLDQVRLVINKYNQNNFEIKTKKINVLYSKHCDDFCATDVQKIFLMYFR